MGVCVYDTQQRRASPVIMLSSARLEERRRLLENSTHGFAYIRRHLIQVQPLNEVLLRMAGMKRSRTNCLLT